MRRNRAASFAIAIAGVLILVIGTAAFCINLDERRHAEREEAKARSEYLRYMAEQNAKLKAQEQAAAALVFQARAAVDGKNLGEAANFVALAETFDDKLGEAKLLHAQLALAQRDYRTAKDKLELLLALHPGDVPAKRLLALVAKADPARANPVLDIEISAQLAGQGAYYLASLVANSLDTQLPILQEKLDRDWPGFGRDLVLDRAKGLTFIAKGPKASFTDLGPLKGLPLKLLHLLDFANLADLGPLAGMPLEDLSLERCGKISDISPLTGMHLRHLDLLGCSRIGDFSVIKGMRLESLILGQCVEFSDLSLLKGMPTRALYLDSCTKFHSLALLTDLPLELLDIDGTEIPDLTPLKKISTLRHLFAYDCQACDLTPLASMQLLSLRVTISPKLVGLELLRHHATLKEINFEPVEVFWRKQDSANPEHSKP